MDLQTIERRSQEAATGHTFNTGPTFQALAAAMHRAAAIEQPPFDGMFISLPGLLRHAARALREMAQPFECDPCDVLEAHDDRCFEAQPTAHAHCLEQLCKHLDMLRLATEAGDSATIRKFFEIYRFDWLTGVEFGSSPRS